MAIQQCITSSFKREILEGIHDLRVDALRVALFVETADLGPHTTTYSAAGEITGTGYAAGGNAIVITPGFPAVDNLSLRGVARFLPVTWAFPSTFSFRGALIYNASKGNRSIAVIDMGTNVGPSNGIYTLETPLTSDPLIVIA